MTVRKRKKICIFSHHHSGNYIPFYVQLYLDELKHYFSEILVVTNERELRNKSEVITGNISLLAVQNEGYDLGMFYKGFQQINSDDYEQIACLNDSNIIFGSLKKIFEWANDQKVDFWGLVDSRRRPKCSTQVGNYHIQSHFIVFNRAAIECLADFFNQINFPELMKERDIRLLKEKVIDIWEIGVTQFLISRDLTCKTYISYREYQQFGPTRKPVNISTKLYLQTIKKGIPVIKKRIITSTEFRHMLSITGNWKRLIRKYGDKHWDIERLTDELTRIRRRHIAIKFFKALKLSNDRVF